MLSRLRKTQKVGNHVIHGHGHMGKPQKHPGGWVKQTSLRLLWESWYEVLPLRNKSFCPTVNLDKLWTLVSEQTRVNAAKNKTGAAPIIDVVRSVSEKIFVDFIWSLPLKILDNLIYLISYLKSVPSYRVDYSIF